MARFIGVILAFVGAGTLLFSEEKKPEPRLLLEIRGPQGTNDARAIYSHIDSLAISPDGKTLAGGAGPHVYLWNVADGSERLRLQLPEKQIYHRMAFSADGKTLVWNGREDPQMRVFDTTTGKQVREIAQTREGQPQGEGFSSRWLCYSPDGRLMAQNGPSFFTEVEIVDLATGKRVHLLKEVENVRAAAFSPDGKLLVTHGGEGGLHLWDVKTGRQFRELAAERSTAGGPFRFVVFSSDGKYLALGGHGRNELDIWSLATRKKVCSLPSRIGFFHAAFSPDNESVLCVEGDGHPYLYHLIAERVTLRFNPPKGQCHHVTWLADGKRVAMLGESTKQEVRQMSAFLYEIPPEVLNPPAAQVDDAALERMWGELTTENELRLARVTRALKAAPGPTLALFRQKLPPVAPGDQTQLDLWIQRLDHDDPRQREAAMKDIRSVAQRFLPMLEKRVADAAPGEVRNRLRFLLSEVKEQPVPVEIVRELRAVDLLANLGTPEATAYLRQLSQGADLARLTCAATAALAER